MKSAGIIVRHVAVAMCRVSGKYRSIHMTDICQYRQYRLPLLCFVKYLVKCLARKIEGRRKAGDEREEQGMPRRMEVAHNLLGIDDDALEIVLAATVAATTSHRELFFRFGT